MEQNQEQNQPELNELQQRALELLAPIPQPLGILKRLLRYNGDPFRDLRDAGLAIQKTTQLYRDGQPAGTAITYALA